jgi:hypothetical protein
MHFCADEAAVLVALVSAIPFLGPWLRAKLRKKEQSHPKPETEKEKHG